jgi:hypothetical protein
MEIVVAHMCPAFVNIAVQAATANVSISTGFLICLVASSSQPTSRSTSPSSSPSSHHGTPPSTFTIRLPARSAVSSLPRLLLAEDVERFSRRTVKVTSQHNEECRKLLALMGIPVVIVSCILPNVFPPSCHLALGAFRG